MEKLPSASHQLFEAKKKKKLTCPHLQAPLTPSFEQIAKEVGRDEVAVAAIFYAQAKPSVRTPASPKVPLTFNSQTI